MLNKLNTLIVKDVKKIDLETDALASMEASEINFDNCKFSDESNVKFKDDSINSKLEFNNCNFPKNSTVFLNSKSDELTVAFNECDFDELKLKITATNLEIKNNRFHQLPDKSSFDVHIRDYLTVIDNHLLSQAKTPMPEVDYSSHPNPVIHVSFLLDKLNPVTVNTWIGAFRMTIDNNKIDKEKTSCEEETKESNEGREHEIKCPNIHSLENYFRSPNFTKLPFSGKEEIQRTDQQKKKSMVSSGAHTIYPIFAVSTLIAIMSF